VLSFNLNFYEKAQEMLLSKHLVCFIVFLE